MTDVNEKISEITRELNEFDRDKCIQRDLIVLGLSKSILKKYYPEPKKKFKDRRQEKYYYLYEVSKVLDFMELDTFIQDFSKTLVRSNKAKLVSENIRRENIKSVDDYKIEVEKISIKELKKLAIKSWEEWNENIWKDDSIEDTNRIMMNYVRHNLTTYEDYLHFQKGMIGTDEMYCLLKDKITEKILEIYPQLKGENKNEY